MFVPLVQSRLYLITLPLSVILSVASILLFCSRFCKSYRDHDLICADVIRGFRISGNTSDIISTIACSQCFWFVLSLS